MQKTKRFFKHYYYRFKTVLVYRRILLKQYCWLKLTYGSFRFIKIYSGRRCIPLVKGGKTGSVELDGKEAKTFTSVPAPDAHHAQATLRDRDLLLFARATRWNLCAQPLDFLSCMRELRHYRCSNRYSVGNR